jgi:predicted lysophospholipase L1 biosynthesis ABC-type transport system permease subunit
LNPFDGKAFAQGPIRASSAETSSHVENHVHVASGLADEHVTLAAVGVLFGLALAWAAGRSLEALLAGVSPRDFATFAAAAGLALATTLLGSLLPAWRAARVDPLTAIRFE